MACGQDRVIVFSAIEMLPVAGGKDAPRTDGRAPLTLDSLGEGLVTTDAQGRIDFVNRIAEELTGISSMEATGKRLTELVSFVDEHDRRPLADPVQQCMASARRVSLGRRALMLARQRYLIERRQFQQVVTATFKSDQVVVKMLARFERNVSRRREISDTGEVRSF